MHFIHLWQGLRNDFQEALEKVDQAFLDEILASQAQDADGRTANDVKVQDDGITYDEIQKMAANLGKGDRDLDMNVITHFIQVKWNFADEGWCIFKYFGTGGLVHRV